MNAKASLIAESFCACDVPGDCPDRATPGCKLAAPEPCSRCGGQGWFADHENECYEDGACSCSGVQVECNCGALRG